MSEAPTYQRCPIDLIKLAFREGWDNALVWFVRTKLNNPTGTVRGLNISARIRIPLVKHKLISIDRRGTTFLRGNKWLINQYKFSNQCVRIYSDTKSIKAFFYATILLLMLRYQKSAVNRKAGKYSMDRTEETGGLSVRLVADYLGINHMKSWRLRKEAQNQGYIQVEHRYSGQGLLSPWELRNHPDKVKLFHDGNQFVKRLSSKIIPFLWLFDLVRLR